MTEVAARKSNFEHDLDNYRSQIEAVLPQHVSMDKFQRTVLTAVARQPALYLEADRRTLFNACIQCASDGLLPDGREAALVIFKTKDRRTEQWIQAVQYMPMVRGIRKMMRNTGEVASAEAHCVYQNDEFDYALGDESHITHKPTLANRGALIGVYAIIKLNNGEVIREVMNREQVEKVRAVSKSKDRGPWIEWEEEMYRKTCLRRASKSAPSSPDLERLWSRVAEQESLAPPDTERLAPARPTRESVGIERQLPEPEAVDPANAGHADLDQEYRAVVGHDRETGELSIGDNTTSPQPIVEPEPPYDGAAVRKALWEGALAETKPINLDDYWQIQKPVWLVLQERAPAEFIKLNEAVAGRLKELRTYKGNPR